MMLKILVPTNIDFDDSLDTMLCVSLPSTMHQLAYVSSLKQTSTAVCIAVTIECSGGLPE